ncbi:Rad52/22 family double-strand break repair protein [Novosphingobium sp. PhB55]|uniref:Rad52/Rad22 family DNA repair protein n=1 Tax=Novosphingobium sp. PhB55 TaxID=2485106 RepID=UPI0010F0DC2B|nr:Rad52/Rad22 family DNA repair protein [Novosphingobium sp. PhB55]TDW63121.1 Rad52/22 family double-strand break repair protein [Novosphingobium sp. PhB55]
MVDLISLQAPFASHEHKWRAQSVARNGRRAQALCYIDARTVQTRLDDVCGVAGWESTFNETPSGRVIASISIDMGARWVSKSDGAGATAMEGEKGGLSDAFKRAAVMWGIGRYLYAIPATWAECDVVCDEAGQPRLRNGKPVWKCWTSRGLRDLDAALRRAIAEAGGQPIGGRAIADRRPALLPAPDPTPEASLQAFKDAAVLPENPWPEEVAALLHGLPDAIRRGTSIEFWSEHYNGVPREWRAFACAEKDRMKRDLRR